MFNTMSTRATLLAIACTVSLAAHAIAETPKQVDVQPGELSAALEILAKQCGVYVVYPSAQLKGLRTQGVSGTLEPQEAFQKLIEGTPLILKMDPSGAMLIALPSSVKPEQTTVTSEESRGIRIAQAGAEGSRQLDEVLVTGSHIRGALSPSQVVSTTQEQIRSAGQTNLGDFIRSIPQNFGGGQNPGVGTNVPEINGSNLNSASTLNLRGLGSDATLTLLNGRRLAQGVATQAIDVSMVPLAAIDRIEVVADGASALYGSDAVAGVANIVLRRDFDGIGASARYGTATDGGNDQQQYGLVAGTTWNAGGVIAVYDYSENSRISADDRSYSRTRAPGLDLFPEMDQSSAMVSAHHALTPSLEIAGDAVFSKRTSASRYSRLPGEYFENGQRRFSQTESFVLAPSLTLSLPGEWSGTLFGSYGQDHSEFGSDQYNNSVLGTAIRGCYCSNVTSGEVNASGPVFALPAGAAKVAVGAGYRSNELDRWLTDARQNFSRSQDAYYAFGELSLPIVAPAMNVRAVERLNLSAAVRYEDYPGIDSVVTPKVGFVYSPNAEFDFKASWGKSFKAPTLYQQYAARGGEADAASYYGGSGFPPGSAAVMIYGANPDLKPEHAKTWSATLVLHPRALDGARFELSYFDIDYRDRVTRPIVYLSQSLSNPQYQDFVTYDPSAELLESVLAGRLFFNYLSGPFDPADVVALIDASNVNVASQSISGVDFLAQYRFGIGRFGTLELSANAAYLESSQQVNAAMPFAALAGTLFNPPHVRARAGATWSHGALSMASFVSHIGGVDDSRVTPAIEVDGMTTVDWTARYQVRSDVGLWDGIGVSAAVQNLFNDKPSVITTSAIYQTPYDSTNYSAVGRFVSVTISKEF